MSSNEEKKIGGDPVLDSALRPTTWDDYIGQTHIKNNLTVLLDAAKERDQMPEHLLFYGPPGLGKTTLAHLISHHTGAGIKITSGPAIEKVSDVASILSNLNSGDILFIDEIHRLNKSIEEVLYPAMESGVIDIVIGKGPSARTVQLELPAFTLIAATTKVASISSPLRSRFSGGVFKLEFYTEEEIAKIVKKSAMRLGVFIDPAAADLIAKRSRFTPRTANYLLKRCRDIAQIEGLDTITTEVVDTTIKLIGIDATGLTKTDIDVLTAIENKFNGGPVGLNTLALSMSEEPSTIEEFHEPFLLQIGFIERTPRGRSLTEAGKKHIRDRAKNSSIEEDLEN
jgi:Holliday junction DNA helicase RuvB